MLGIEAVHFIRSERTDKNYLKSQALKADSIQEELFLGAAQAGDSEIPEVYVHDRFLGFIEDVLPSVVGKHSQTGLYLADTVAGITSIDAEKKYGKVKRFLFAVGPELGWNEFEREQWGKAGAQPISLGERILRVDAACVALFWRVAILQSG
jgi:RsmE family RNA methyltransferase